MKIAPAQAESFCQKPPVNVQAILVYGVNDGLVRTRAESCVGTVLEDTRDPFRFAEFDAQKLRSDPALFHDETRALSLIGGRRVVRVRRATDQVSDLLGTFMEQAVDSVLVVVDAGSLGPRSSLRKLFEGNVNAAAIACYEDSDSEIEQFLRRYCQEKGIEIDTDACRWLISHVGRDRKQIETAFNKVVLYATSDRSNEEVRITLDIVQTCVDDAASASLDTLIHAVLRGRNEMVDQLLHHVFREGVAPIGVLRAMSRHLRRLDLATSLLSDGGEVGNIIRSLRPPLFGPAQAEFRAQLNQWQSDRVRAALELVTDAEIKCKNARLPAAVICSRALMRISFAARRS